MTKSQTMSFYATYGWSAKMLEDLNQARIKLGYPPLWEEKKNEKAVRARQSQ